MKYQWIFFDADETLFHFDNFAGLVRMFSKHGIDFKQSDFDAYQAINKPLWVEYQNGSITAEQLQTRRFKHWSEKLAISERTLNKEFLDAMAEICETLTGAEQLVQSLTAQGVKLGIITNGFKQLQKVRLEKTGLDQYFDSVITSEEIGVAKPNPIIFEAAMKSLSVTDKTKVLMVGDTLESDILGGIKFGIDTCWLNSHNKTNNEIKPTFEVTSLQDLLAYLSETN